MRRQSGFTLVEIAIVLVVIGLLLGGVLKGQELVLNSRIRNAINEYNNVASATFAYQDRYRQIPGDDNGAAARWAGAGIDGNRNGTIDGTSDYTNGTAAGAPAETGIFWNQMRNDQLVVGPTTGADSQLLPRNAFDGYTGIRQNAFAGAGQIFGLAICQSSVTTKPADIIDTRIDDGDGSSGILQAGLDTGAGGGGADLTIASVDYVANSRYTLCRQL